MVTVTAIYQTIRLASQQIEPGEFDMIASQGTHPSFKLVFTTITALGVVACSADLAIAQRPYPLWHQLEPGSDAVGFKLLHVVSETESGGRRVVRIGLWYPATAQSSDRTMNHGDYVKMSPKVVEDDAFETFMNKEDRKSQGRQFFDENAERHQESLESARVAAIHHARMKVGRFPLVIHSLGRNGNLFQHTILWEYLASHGFVTAAIGQFGKDLEDPWMDFNVEDLQYQLNDMRIVLDDLSSRHFVDSTKIGAIGHSSGAVLALWLAADRPEIKAVIGLDGSINRLEGKEVFESGLGNKSVTSAFLNICRWPHDEYHDGFMVNLKGDIIRIGFEKGIHFDFQNWPAYQAFAQASEPSSMAVRSLDEARDLFVSTANFTRLFLEQHLNGDRNAGELLKDKTKKPSSGQASFTTMK